jgi:hypothetical protein
MVILAQQGSSEPAVRQPGAVTLAGTVYGAHSGVVAGLALLAVFGRSGNFHAFFVLWLVGFLLSAGITVLTLFRRRGFSYRRTLLVFALAAIVAISAVAAHEAWARTRWPGNRECLHRLAESVVKTFSDLTERQTVTLDGYGELHSAHARSPEFASQIRACGLSHVTVERDQIQLYSDELIFLSPPGGYVFRYGGLPELTECPYGLTGRDGVPGRPLESRWYYCRG